MNDTAWYHLEKDRERLQPTPPIGTPVQWYQGGEKAAAYAALVTGIEGPGRLKLVIFPINQFHQHKLAVHHVSHQVHDKPGNSTTKNSGSWDYAPGVKFPHGHYELHEAELNKREANLKAQDEAAKKAEEAALLPAEPKPKKKIVSPEPLPAATV
jgi:hypothetical protein